MTGRLTYEELEQKIKILQESEEQYRKIFDHSAFAIALTDLKTGKRVAFNRKAHEIHGYTREEFQKLGPKDLSFGEPSPGHNREQHRRIPEQGSVSFETKHRKKDGSVIDLLVSAAALTIGGREFIQTISVDITGQKKIEKELRESEKTYRALFEHAGFGITLLDPGMNPRVMFNRKAHEQLGYTREEFADPEKTGVLDSIENREDITRHHREIIENGPQVFETRHRKKDGEYIDVLISAVPVDIGRKHYIQNIVQDITERKRAERQLIQYKEHLEELVRERTLELEKTQQELLRSERLSVLGQLTATVAHEIRNPLGTVRTSVFSIADAIKLGQYDRVNRAVELAERNIHRCDQIISELLEYSRRQEPDQELADIDPWIKNIVDEMPIPGEIRVDLDLNAENPVYFDREQLRRAVVNILTNSIQAIEEQQADTRYLNIKTRTGKDRLEIQITDSGTGIDKSILDRIFEPLFSTKAFGVGLGMSIVKKIMEDNDGGIEIESTVNKGTTVTIWLPLKQGN